MNEFGRVLPLNACLVKGAMTSMLGNCEASQGRIDGCFQYFGGFHSSGISVLAASGLPILTAPVQALAPAHGYCCK